MKSSFMHLLAVSLLLMGPASSHRHHRVSSHNPIEVEQILTSMESELDNYMTLGLQTETDKKAFDIRSVDLNHLPNSPHLLSQVMKHLQKNIKQDIKAYEKIKEVMESEKLEKIKHDLAKEPA